MIFEETTEETLSTDDSAGLTYRQANAGDLPLLIEMLADDTLGRRREDISQSVHPRYLEAFSSISEDENNELVVVEFEGDIVGMMQLTFIPYLTHTGSWRCLIEGVRVHSAYRARGFGATMFHWAIDRAKSRACSLVQLTSNKQRPDALRFYESLGFEATHEGFKLAIAADTPGNK